MNSSKQSKILVFTDENFGWWKLNMKHYIKSIIYQCWKIIEDGPLVIEETDILTSFSKVKAEKDYNENDFKLAEKNSIAMSILQRCLGEAEVSRISGCPTAKLIWDSLVHAYEGTSQVKKHHIDLLMQQYEMFRMSKDESIKNFSYRFSCIINELKGLGRDFEFEDIVRKILLSLTPKWQPKVTAIEEARDLSILTLHELIGSLMAHEFNLNKNSSGSLKGKSLALMSSPSDDEDEEEDEFAMFSRNIVGILNGQGNIRFNNNYSKKRFPKKRSTSTIGCFKCGDKTHQIKECPKWEEIKSKDKRKKAKKEYKHKVMSAIWGICLMAHPNDSDSNSDNEVKHLKAKIEEIAQENFHLKNQLKVTDSATVTSEAYDEVKRVKKLNKELSKGLECLKSTPNIVSDLENVNTTLITEMSIITKERDELLKEQLMFKGVIDDLVDKVEELKATVSQTVSSNSTKETSNELVNNLTNENECLKVNIEAYKREIRMLHEKFVKV
ncbi:uncharacterized protein LOC141629802 [Silene latifolia]|uniref:uncharacterized protein LOC141629802 n=1 Tax=Silene latifolia TaxID=37657 RepID=UPI003D782484